MKANLLKPKVHEMGSCNNFLGFQRILYFVSLTQLNSHMKSKFQIGSKKIMNSFDFQYCHILYVLDFCHFVWPICLQSTLFWQSSEESSNVSPKTWMTPNTGLHLPKNWEIHWYSVRWIMEVFISAKQIQGVPAISTHFWFQFLTFLMVLSKKSNSAILTQMVLLKFFHLDLYKILKIE